MSHNQFYALLYKLSDAWNVKIHDAYLYCGNQHSQLAEAREVLGEPPRAIDKAGVRSWQEVCEAAGMESACRCPKCGAILVSHHSFQPGRGPPVAAFRQSTQGQAA